MLRRLSSATFCACSRVSEPASSCFW